jgi:methyl-accepting chemotaxis protein
MKLRTQILLIGMAGALVSALVGGVGLLSVSTLVTAFDGAVSMGNAAQNSQRASMMHGAIRGEVQRAMLGAIGR